MFNKEYAFASCDTLRNDPQGRTPSVVIFEAKGYKPRMPGNIFNPIDWPHKWLIKEKDHAVQQSGEVEESM